jgi:hypothetical protein
VAPVPLATASGGGGGGGGHAAPRPVPAKRRPIGPGGPPARSDREMARTARYITPTMNAGQIQPVIDLLRQGGIALTKGPHQPGAWHFTVGNIHFYFTQGSDPWQITSYSIEKQVGQRPPRSMGGGSFH